MFAGCFLIKCNLIEFDLAFRRTQLRQATPNRFSFQINYSCSCFTILKHELRRRLKEGDREEQRNNNVPKKLRNAMKKRKNTSLTWLGEKVVRFEMRFHAIRL